MTNGRADLQKQIDRIRKLEEFAEDSTPAVAKAVAREISKQVDKGLGPDGKPWQLTKDGKRPLKNAASAITSQSEGSTIIIRLTGRHARHHLGMVKGGIKRAVIPTKDIPDPVTRAIRAVLSQRFSKIMGAK